MRDVDHVCKLGHVYKQRNGPTSQPTVTMDEKAQQLWKAFLHILNSNEP